MWSGWYDNYASIDMLYTVVYYKIFYNGSLGILDSTIDWCNKFNGLFSRLEERINRQELRDLEAEGKPTLQEAVFRL